MTPTTDELLCNIMQQQLNNNNSCQVEGGINNHGTMDIKETTRDERRGDGKKGDQFSQ